VGLPMFSNFGPVNLQLLTKNSFLANFILKKGEYRTILGAKSLRHPSEAKILLARSFHLLKLVITRGDGFL